VISNPHAKSDLMVVLSAAVLLGLVAFAVTREEAFFAPPKNPGEKERQQGKAKSTKEPRPRQKRADGRIGLDDPSMPQNVQEAFEHFNDASEADIGSRFADAEKDFIKACELDPKRKLYWSGLGNCYQHQGKYQQSLAAFQKTYELDCYDVNNLDNMGYASQALRRDTEAAGWYLASLTILPEQADAWMELYNIMHGLGLEQFYNICNDMHHFPTNSDNSNNVYRINDYMLGQSPDDYYLLVNRAMLRTRSLQAPLAQLDLNRALQLKPDGKAALFAQAQIYMQQNESDKAEAIYRKIVKDCPQPMAYAQLGAIALGRGDTKEALFDYGHAAEYGEDKPSYGYTYTNLKNEEADRALKASQKAAAEAALNGSDKSGAK
jgi:tetratricopeptide (TPR) repeat protein